MRKSKKKSLEAAGWKVGSAAEFLDLTPDEQAYIETKLALAESLKRYRNQRRLTQTQLAKLLHTSQSRVAKMEAADPSVSLDLLMRALFAVGASRGDLGSLLVADSNGESFEKSPRSRKSRQE